MIYVSTTATGDTDGGKEVRNITFILAPPYITLLEQVGLPLDKPKCLLLAPWARHLKGRCCY